MNCIAFQVINNVKYLTLTLEGHTVTFSPEYFLSHDLQHLLHKVFFSNEEEAQIYGQAMQWKIHVSAEAFYCMAYPQFDCSSFTELCNADLEVDVPDSGLLFYFNGDVLERVYM